MTVTCPKCGQQVEIRNGRYAIHRADPDVPMSLCDKSAEVVPIVDPP